MDEAKIKKDFIEFSGGCTPDVAESEMRKYIKHHKHHVPGSTKQQVQELFDRWIAAIESGQEPRVW